MTEILKRSKDKAKSRKTTIDWFILLANALKELSNFSSMIAVLMGLNSTPISRLARSWELVENMKLYLQLSQYIDHSHSFANYRNLLSTSTQMACLPFFAVILQDLTFIEDGTVKKEKGKQSSHHTSLSYSLSSTADSSQLLSAMMAMEEDFGVSKETGAFFEEIDSPSSLNKKKKKVNIRKCCLQAKQLGFIRDLQASSLPLLTSKSSVEEDQMSEDWYMRRLFCDLLTSPEAMELSEMIEPKTGIPRSRSSISRALASPGKALARLSTLGKSRARLNFAEPEIETPTHLTCEQCITELEKSSKDLLKSPIESIKATLELWLLKANDTVTVYKNSAGNFVIFAELLRECGVAAGVILEGFYLETWRGQVADVARKLIPLFYAGETAFHTELLSILGKLKSNDIPWKVICPLFEFLRHPIYESLIEISQEKSAQLLEERVHWVVEIPFGAPNKTRELISLLQEVNGNFQRKGNHVKSSHSSYMKLWEESIHALKERQYSANLQKKLTQESADTALKKLEESRKEWRQFVDQVANNKMMLEKEKKEYIEEEKKLEEQLRLLRLKIDGVDQKLNEMNKHEQSVHKKMESARSEWEGAKERSMELHHSVLSDMDPLLQFFPQKFEKKIFSPTEKDLKELEAMVETSRTRLEQELKNIIPSLIKPFAIELRNFYKKMTQTTMPGTPPQTELNKMNKIQAIVPILCQLCGVSIHSLQDKKSDEKVSTEELAFKLSKRVARILRNYGVELIPVATELTWKQLQEAGSVS
jgi:hypothetical protein